MKQTLLLAWLLVFILTACGSQALPPSTVQPNTSAPVTPTLPPAESLSLFAQGKDTDRQRYQFAVNQGAQFLTTPDGKSFYVLWYPKGTSTESHLPIIVTLHGHSSWAFDEFYLWQPYAAERGYGIIALQWWFGGSEERGDYYQPQEFYHIFDIVLPEQDARPGTVLAHGFSRGSANIYGVTAYDRQADNNFFLLTVANAGKASPDFPINANITAGDFGPQPFAGTHWVMFCGAEDPHPDLGGCPGMRETREWVTQFGGTMDLLIEDPNGGHGGFHRNPANVNAALDVFDRLLER